MEEIWKDVVGYEGLYQVSNYGSVRNIKKNPFFKLKPMMKRGYKNVGLSNKIVKYHTVHRLVALAFINNELSKPTVNHIDGIKINNNVDNLEWCTYSENSLHAIRIGIASHKNCGVPVKIDQYDKNMNFIKSFDSFKAAHEEINTCESSINRCARKERKSAGGYIWRIHGEI